VSIQAVQPAYCGRSDRFLPDWNTFDHEHELVCYVFLRSTGPRLGLRCIISRA
jgi:hypothetical protein